MLKKGFPAVFIFFLTVASFAVATPAHSEDLVVFAKDFAIGNWHLRLSYQTFWVCSVKRSVYFPAGFSKGCRI